MSELLKTAAISALCAALALLAACDGGADRDPEPAESSVPQRCRGALDEDEFHYIVVGSGAGGGPVASRLAEAGCQVLLLEAGEDVGDHGRYRVPAMHALSTEDPAMAWWFWVQHHFDRSDDERDTKYTDEGILYPRGSALGGSTAVNALVTVLPPPSDWNRLAELTGSPEFRASEMQPTYDKVREWLSIELPDPALAMSDASVVDYLLAAASAFAAEGALGGSVEPGDAVGTASALGSLLQQDLNASLATHETSGLFRLPLATRDGKRNGTRELILDTVEDGHPLTVRTGSFVTRVLWDNPNASHPRAVGVEYVTGAGVYGASLAQGQAMTTRHASADVEVILSAGVFNSPQLLMLSGVGDANHLSEHGIDVVVDRPGVGLNLQDRYEVAVVTELDEPLAIIEDCDLLGKTASDPCLDDWVDGGGVYETSGFLATVLRRSSEASPLSDLQVFATTSDARGYFPGYASAALEDARRFSWLILKAHTKNSDGYVRLKSADPFQSPKIVFNSFDELDPMGDPDLQAVVSGVEFVRDIEARMQARMVSGHLEELWPGSEVQSREDIAQWIRDEAWGHHASCTNKMGPPSDPLAVVDTSFRVIGTRGLRVVDASVFPEIPGTFIALPTFMLSERAAQILLDEATWPPE